MDVRTLLIRCHTAPCLSRPARAKVGMPLAVAALLAAAGCGFFRDFGTLGSSVTTDGSQTDVVDLSVDGGTTCRVDYYNDGLSYGFDLSIAAGEASTWNADADALFGHGWDLLSDGATIHITTQVVAAPYPADLEAIVAAANEAVTIAGGSVGSAFSVILSNGDAAIQTNYRLDGTIVYRLDTTKNDRRYTLAVSVAEADLSQAVDNTMVATVTSLCVD